MKIVLRVPQGAIMSPKDGLIELPIVPLQGNAISDEAYANLEKALGKHESAFLADSFTDEINRRIALAGFKVLGMAPDTAPKTY